MELDETMEEFNALIAVKASAVVKDIAKRIANTPMYFPSKKKNSEK